MRTLLQLYLQDCRIRGKARRTIEGYQRDCLKFIAFSEIEPRRIDAACLLDFLDTLQADPKIHGDTAARYFRSLRRFLNWASHPDRAYFPVSPAAGLAPRFRLAGEKTPPTAAYLRALLARLPRANPSDRRDWAALNFIYYTGVRSGEALALKLADLDLTRRTAQIYAEKTNSHRPVPLVDPLLVVLVGWIGHVRGPYLFPSYKGGGSPHISVNSLYQRWRDHQLALGIPADQLLTVHMLRHAFCTHSHAAGVDIASIQRVAGHKRITTTLRYTHPTPETLVDHFQKVWA